MDINLFDLIAIIQGDTIEEEQEKKENKQGDTIEEEQKKKENKYMETMASLKKSVSCPDIENNKW